MELAYSRSGPRGGNAEPLLLIHGIGHRRGGWDPVVKKLQKEFDVISVDLPGFGDSPSLPGDGPLALADVKAALLEQFPAWGIERPHIAGNSLGGLLALELASEGNARSATALSPAGFNRRLDRVQPWFMLRATWVLSRYIPKALLRTGVRLPILRQVGLATVYARAKDLKGKERATDAVIFGRSPGFGRTLPITTRHRFTGSIAVPTAVVWGSKDRVYRHGLSKRAAKQLPNGQHITLGGAGHVTQGDAPDQVAEIIAATARRTNG